METEQEKLNSFIIKVLSRAAQEVDELKTKLITECDNKISEINKKLGNFTEIKNNYTEEELFALTKAEQIAIINSYNVTEIPQYEAERVALILTLQGGTA